MKKTIFLAVLMGVGTQTAYGMQALSSTHPNQNDLQILRDLEVMRAVVAKLANQDSSLDLATVLPNLSKLDGVISALQAQLRPASPFKPVKVSSRGPSPCPGYQSPDIFPGYVRHR